MNLKIFETPRSESDCGLADALQRLVNAVDRWDMVDMESAEYRQADRELDAAMHAARMALGSYSMR